MAQLAMMVSSAFGGKAELTDYMPSVEKKETDKVEISNLEGQELEALVFSIF